MGDSVRLLVVLGIALVVALSTWRHRAWRRRLHEPRADPLVPAHLVAGRPRTWVLFTTPTCANCGPVEARLRAFDPGGEVVKVDATRQPGLARAFDVRAAPTVLLADGDGRVRARLVGPAAVERYVEMASA